MTVRFNFTQSQYISVVTEWSCSSGPPYSFFDYLAVTYQIVPAERDLTQMIYRLDYWAMDQDLLVIFLLKHS